jgi:hypothetical protein
VLLLTGFLAASRGTALSLDWPAAYLRALPEDDLQVIGFVRPTEKSHLPLLKLRNTSDHTVEGVLVQIATQSKASSRTGAYVERWIRLDLEAGGYYEGSIPLRVLPTDSVVIAISTRDNPGASLLGSPPFAVEDRRTFRVLFSFAELMPNPFDISSCCSDCARQSEQCGTNKKASPPGGCAGSLCFEQYNCSATPIYHDDGTVSCGALRCNVVCKPSGDCCF